MKPDWAGLLGFLWLVVLALALVVSAAGAYAKVNHVEEHAWGCDPFGYLRMAKEVRRGAARGEYPDYRLETLQARRLIEAMKVRGIPAKEWGEMVAPHAHHYFPLSDRIGVQYPPGTGLFLAIFPEGEAVHGMGHTVIAIFVGVGLGALVVAGVKRAWAAAGGVVFGLQVGLEMLAGLGAVSFSVNAVLAPIVVSLALVFIVLALRSAGRPFLGAAAAFAGGMIFGFAVLVRLPVLFLVPGAALLLVGFTRRTLLNSSLVAFGLGLSFGGVVPLLVHQQQITGAWNHSTYGSDDNSPPSLAVVEKNVECYFRGGPGSQHNWAVPIALVGLLAVAVATWCQTQARPGAGRLLAAVALIGGISTAYFLTHKIAILYYQFPALLAVVVGLGLAGLFLQAGRPDLRHSELTPHGQWRSAGRGIALTIAFLPGVVAIEEAWGTRPRVPLSVEVPPRRMEFPAELTDPSAWVFADLMTGPLWYYAEKPAYKVTFASAATRAAGFRIAFEHGGPQFIVRDCDSMQDVIHEVEQLGGQIEPRGMVDHNPYFRIRWPAAGPRGDSAGGR